MQPASQRRSRFIARSTDRNVHLVERDFEIFRLLDRFHVLTREDLVAFIKPKSTKRFVERLGHLFHDGRYLERPAQQWQTRDRFRSPVVYSLSDAGHNLLLDHGMESRRAVIRSRQQPGYRIPQFDHALAISQSLAALERQTLGSLIERFIPLEEILSHKSSAPNLARVSLALPVNIPGGYFGMSRDFKTQVVPDGLYGIEYLSSGNSKYRFFPIELERTTPLQRRTLTKSSTAKKIVAYRALLYSGDYKQILGVPKLFPHFIARDDEHKARIEELAASLLSSTELALFRFSSCTDRLA